MVHPAIDGGAGHRLLRLPDDIPAPADYDWDGKADIAVCRPSVGGWFIQQSRNGALRTEFLGLIGDIPVPRMP